MTIWLLAVLLIGSVAAIGYRQGAVRVAFSLVAIPIGAALAGPLGALLYKPLMNAGIKSPVTAWALGPLIVFVFVSFLFKIGGFTVHDALETRYKKSSGSEGPVAWTRLNRRLGLVLGLVNGTLYLCLVCFGIYTFSYWTVQVSSSLDSRSLSLLNRAGNDLEQTGFVKVARAVHTFPKSYYELADLVGTLYNNSLLAARVSTYPGFLPLGQRPDFEGLSTDKNFLEMWQRRDPIESFQENSHIKAIVNNTPLMAEIWNTTRADLADLNTYLATGKSPKYDAIPLLGRWSYDVHAASLAARRSHPNIGALEMQRLKQALSTAYLRTQLIALPNHQVVIKQLPQPSTTGLGSPQNYQGEWTEQNGSYEVSLQKQNATEVLGAGLQGDRLTLKSPLMEYFFVRAD